MISELEKRARAAWKRDASFQAGATTNPYLRDRLHSVAAGRSAGRTLNTSTQLGKQEKHFRKGLRAAQAGSHQQGRYRAAVSVIGEQRQATRKGAETMSEIGLSSKRTAQKALQRSTPPPVPGALSPAAKKRQQLQKKFQAGGFGNSPAAQRLLGTQPVQQRSAIGAGKLNPTMTEPRSFIREERLQKPTRVAVQQHVTADKARRATRMSNNISRTRAKGLGKLFGGLVAGVGRKLVRA